MSQTQSHKGTVLVLDDEKNIRQSLQLVPEGYHVLSCHEPVLALQALRDQVVDLAIVDIRLGDIDGLSFYQKLKVEGLEVPTIFISGHATLTEAAKTIQLGAFDFIEKPFTPERILLSVERCLEHQALRQRVTELRKRLGETRLLGDSPAIARIKEQISRIGPTQSTILIQGESGTGKELIAELAHAASTRHDRPFIKVNCSAIPESLIESELFGHERGAFTGALQAKKGFFELANGGTLFLDEIGDLSLSAQAKVLRAIQSGEIQKVGSERVLKVNVRLITATHKDLKSEVQAERFREDLYYRLNVIPLLAPPLRERAEDIPLLCLAFVNRVCETNGLPIKAIEPEALAQLKSYPWPGNVRELQNVMERLVIMSGEHITRLDLPDEIYAPTTSHSSPLPSSAMSLREFRDASERLFIVEALRRAEGNVSQAARVLQIERTYLHKRMLQFDIQKKEYFL